MINTKSFLTVLAGALLSIPSAFADPAGSEPGETWTSLGTGYYRENGLSALYAISSFPEVEVEIQESDLHKGRYRLVNPYANYPKETIGSPGCLPGDSYIYINASDPEHVFLETSRTGFIGGEDQELILGSLADDYYNNRYGNWEQADKEGICGKLIDGCITFPSRALLASLYNYTIPWDDDILWAYCGNARFRVKLPGAPDLDVAITADGIDDAHENLYFNLTLGKSIEKALVALVKEESPSDDTYSKIVDGTIASITVTEDGTVSIPYTGDGIHTLMVIPYFEGTPRQVRSLTLEIAYDESEWRKAGKATYTEAYLADNECFKNPLVQVSWPEAEYAVNVEESVEKPGYIRLVNPYGPDYPYSRGYNFDDTRNWYLYIDATDPDKVKVETSLIGLDITEAFTGINVSSKAYRYLTDPAWGWDDERVTKAGLYGSFKDNRITFPPETLSIKFAANPTVWYQANENGNFTIKFEPGQINGKQSGISTLPAGGDLPAEYFSIDGLRLDADNLPSGIIIVKKGAEVKKIIR